MNADVLEGFCWHSSIGIDSNLEGNKEFVTRIAADRQAMSMFFAAGKDTLIHKTTKCLWRLSEDKKTIEPMFGSDVLSSDDVQTVMEGGQ